MTDAPPRVYVGLLDAAGQQAAWWSTVLLVIGGHANVAWAGTLTLVVLHVAFTPDRVARILAAFGAALLGFVVDTGLVALQVIDFGGARVSPPWMVGLWAAFGVGLFVSLRWIRARPRWQQFTIGGAAGLIAYHAGGRLGALSVGDGVLPNVGLGIAWGMAMIALSSGADTIEARDDSR